MKSRIAVTIGALASLIALPLAIRLTHLDGARKNESRSELAIAASAGQRANTRSADRLIEPSTNARWMEASYSTDLTDARKLIGASHNVFVATVVRQIGNKQIGKSPQTQFTVDVLLNIKGDLVGSVVVNQYGGYVEKQLYLIGGDSGLLKPGATYLFATRYNDSEKWYTISAPPFDRKLLSKDPELDRLSLLQMAEQDARVSELRAAYPSEILLKADINNRNTRNSYLSLHTIDIPAPTDNAFPSIGPNTAISPITLPSVDDSVFASDSAEAAIASSESSVSPSPSDVESLTTAMPSESTSPSPSFIPDLQGSTTSSTGI